MVNKSMADKEELNLKLAEIYDHLEELEGVLEAAFTKERYLLNKERLMRISAVEKQLSAIEDQFNHSNTSDYEDSERYSNRLKNGLNLELGF